MTAELDKTYNQDIHPLIERIALVCKQEGIPIFISCQLGDEFRTSVVNNETAGFDKFKLYRMVSETWTHDELLDLMIEDAKSRGHHSRILRAMGIPSKTLDAEDRRRILSESKQSDSDQSSES
ncbi:hypothetical protein [Vibrio owensii]|uniref:hypothetical protein n=1 Tax=Vibrio harveyi group TaxID=717610 RepID=UPI003CC5DA6D